MSAGTGKDLSQVDRDRISLHDTTMDVALAEGKTLWEAQALALQAVVDAETTRAAAEAWDTAADAIDALWQAESPQWPENYPKNPHREAAHG